MLTLLIAASSITGKEQGVIRVTLPSGKNKIAFFDTEQSDYYVELMSKRIVMLVQESGAKISKEEIQEKILVYKLRTEKRIRPI